MLFYMTLKPAIIESLTKTIFFGIFFSSNYMCKQKKITITNLESLKKNTKTPI